VPSLGAGDSGTSAGRKFLRRTRCVVPVSARHGVQTLDPQPVKADIKPAPSLSQLSSISGSAGGYVAHIRKDDKKPKAPARAPGKTALQAISQSGGVGEDLRGSRPGSSASSSKGHTAANTSVLAFLKPAGVNVPSVKTKVRSGADDIQGARAVKRARDGTEGEKKKKRKKRPEVNAEEQ
jgi:hypothetical protein